MGAEARLSGEALAEQAQQSDSGSITDVVTKTRDSYSWSFLSMNTRMLHRNVELEQSVYKSFN